MPSVPALFLDAGEKASWRVIEFFTANIRNRNTREAYARAVVRFCHWCDKKHLVLRGITPFVVAGYIEQLGTKVSRPTVKQHLAALRMLFDYLVTGQIVPMNPLNSVRGPKHVVRKGKTPVMSTDEARLLLDSLETDTITGLRDRALISVMLYSFARVGACVAMDVDDFYRQKNQRWFRLHEKGGKRHDLPAHPKAEEYVNAYLRAAGGSGKTPLFRSIDRKGEFTERRMDRRDVLTMIKRRVKRAGLPSSMCCHSLRATGITAYLLNGGTLEQAQQMAAHESSSTTKLYDRRNDYVTIDEVERIRI